MLPLWENGPKSNRVNVVVLGDGYTEPEIDTVYDSHVRQVLDHIFFAGEDPFPRYQHFFNVYRIDLVSNERGADVPPEGIDRDTALDASYYADGAVERLLSIDAVKANRVIAEAMVSDPFSPDIRLVAVNSDAMAARAVDPIRCSPAVTWRGELVLHELGHSFSGLGDEYGGLPESYDGPEPRTPNITTSPDGDKWSRWIGYEQPGIGVIGAYEGGESYDYGLYRPSLNSKTARSRPALRCHQP